ncbi:hypothetical protein D3C87_1354970 [compost metagenome]
MDQPYRRLVVRGANRQLQQLTVAHGANAGRRGFDHRAGVEDIDVALMGKTLGAEDFQCRFAVGVRFANHRLRLFGEQAGVNGLAGHQFGDERLVAQSGQVIGMAEIHLEKVSAHAVPEGRAALFIGTAAQLGDEFVAEQVRELRHKQQSAQRQ